MASLFRKRIASHVVSAIKPFLETSENILMYDAIPPSLQLRQQKGFSPQFELSWKNVVKFKLDLNNRIHPTTVLSYLKNQDFPTVDGITSISLDNTQQAQILFTIDQDLFTSTVLLDICNKIDNLACRSCYFRNIPPENVIVEYSSPNMAKPFHFGHFRSTIIGNIWANICKYVGHDVTRINYIGDWGLQYGILAFGYDQFGSEEKLKAEPLTHLYEVYKKANAKSTSEPKFKEAAKKYFQRLEEGDEHILSQWKRFRDLSLKEMETTYKRLNITFDEVHGESMYVEKARLVFHQLLKEGLAQYNEDNSIEAIVSTENEREENVLIRKSDGTSLYLSRDIAAAIERKKALHFDSAYYVVDATQAKHFSYLKSILKSMGYSWSSAVHHISYGRILNFSTRKGTAVFLHDILNEAKERTLEGMKNSPTTKVKKNLDKIAEILGVSALIVNDACCRRKKEYHFSWDKILSMKGDSGVTLQYCHARLNNIKENCGVNLSLNCDLSYLVEPEAIDLIAHLARFDETIYNTYIEQEPSILVHYLFGLRIKVGRAIKVLTVKGENSYIAKARLVLFYASNLVLKKGLQLLGITPLDKM